MKVKEKAVVLKESALLSWTQSTVTNTDPAYFGQGTKLTVLGKYFTLILCFDGLHIGLSLSIDRSISKDFSEINQGEKEILAQYCCTVTTTTKLTLEKEPNWLF